jgi:hypothetical protein
MRELIMLAKVTKRMLKQVIKVCKRGARQEMYADSDMRHMLESALVPAPRQTGPGKADTKQASTLQASSPIAVTEDGQKRASSIWRGLRATVRVFGGGVRSGGDSVDHSDQDDSAHGKFDSPVQRRHTVAEGSFHRKRAVARSSSFASLA